MPLWLHGQRSNYTYQCCHSAGVLSGRYRHSAVMDFCHIAAVLLYKSGGIATVLSRCWHIGIQHKTARQQFYFNLEFSRWLSGFLENWILAVCLIAALIQQCTTYIVHYIHSTLRYYIIMYVIHARICDHITYMIHGLKSPQRYFILSLSRSNIKIIYLYVYIDFNMIGIK